VISSVGLLTPGQAATARGANLQLVTRVTVDGREAVITQAGNGELTFTVPALRACETDGRGVEVVANDAVRITGIVSAPELVQLQPGESRVLAAADLACIRLPATAGAYVVSAHNDSRLPQAEPFFRLRTYTTSADTTAGAFSPFSLSASPANGDREQHLIARPSAAAATHQHSAAAAPFDPRYATAAAGDTLTFVDWSDIRALTAATRDQVPVYRAVVLAVEGRQVVVLDLRTPDAAQLLASSTVRQRFRRAAEIAERYTIPALRAVIDPQASFPGGAGGRVFTVLQGLPAGVAGGISTTDLLDTSYSRWVSNIGVVNLSAELAREPNVRPEQIASTIIHEQAHLADVVAARTRGVAGSAGWFSEALAVCVEERAARLAVGQESQVTMTQAQADGVPAAAMRMPDGTAERYSPWGGFGTGVSASSTGAYVRGSRLVLFAMELMGETGFAPSARSLYQRLLVHSAAPGTRSATELERIWGIDAVAREAGISAEELMDWASLAELSDDLVEGQVADARGLPQFRTWNNALASRDVLQQRIFPTHWLPLNHARGGEISVPGGAHHYFYVVTEPTGGLSLSATQVRLQSHHRVRVTRLW
jgi:plastocyanin